MSQSTTDLSRVLTAPDGSPQTLIDSHGRTVEVSEVLRDRTTIVVLVRHFLCVYCQEYFTQVWNEFIKTDYYRSQKQASNQSINQSDHPQKIQLIVIGNGSPSLGRSLATEIGAEGDDLFGMYVDRSKQVYDAFDCVHGISEFRCDDCVYGTLRALWQGLTRCWCFCQSGDVQQQGGVFVIKPTDQSTDQSSTPSLQCVFSHVDQDGRDHANISDVFRAAGINK